MRSTASKRGDRDAESSSSNTESPAAPVAGNVMPTPTPSVIQAKSAADATGERRRFSFRETTSASTLSGMGRLVNLHPNADSSESDLIDACRRGERGALDQVFRAHVSYLERVLARVAGRTLDVEDLLQSTLMAAMLAFPSFRGEAHVRTWLARIAVHVAHDRLRSAARARRRDAALPDGEVARPPGPVGSEETLDQRRRLERLEVHLSALGPKKRIAFVLHVFEGLELEEVAALMGAGVAATKSRVFWARRELLRRARRDPLLRDLAEGRDS
jgi:RNA polymerase sigma-70 factor (ECF subfamily)